MQTIELDCRGQKCPAPILNIAKAAKQLKGQPAVIQVLADDEAFPLDLKSWCRTTKASLLNVSEAQGVFRASVELNAEASAESQPARAIAISPTPIPEAPMKAVRLLDYRGLSCPKPILNIAQEYRNLPVGDRVEVLADDPAFLLDIRSWGRSAGALIKELGIENGAQKVSVSRASESLNRSSSSPSLRSVQAAQTPIQSAQPATNALAPVVQVTADDSEIKLKLSGMTPAQREQKLQALSQLGISSATLTCDDASFNTQLVAWCSAQGHTLSSLQTVNGAITAKVALSAEPKMDNLPVLASKQETALATTSNECTLLVLHNDFEALMASLMTANAAAASGMKTTVFFSFWGVNLLRADTPQNIPSKSKPNFFQRMFAWMMPKGPRRQQLGKLNFGGFGTGIMKGIMAKHQIMGLDSLMESAAAQGVKFIVCSTSMTIMGIDQRDIAPLPNIEFGGVASFVDYAKSSSVSLVF
jgi:TusA-related sulfurtransferase/peroxiredoxin family protein